MRYETVLFDLDGTLIDGREGILASLGAALERHGIAPPSDLARVIGPPLQDVFGGLGVADSQIDAAIEAYRDVYEAGAIRLNRAFVGIDSLLARLHAEGVTLGVCTSKPWVYAEAIVAQRGWTDQMQVVIGPELDGTRRHKPEILTCALERLGDPDRARTVMIGDRHYDIDGARAVGVSSIAVTWGFGGRAELDACRPDHVVESADELYATLHA